MKVTLVRGRDLSLDLTAAWLKLQRINPSLASPYFHPEFTRVIASVRKDVEIAIIEHDGSVAFLPFQRRWKSIGIPVGGIISDYQGLICTEQFACDPRELVRCSRLSIFDFDHFLASQTSFAQFARYSELSPQIDLSAGYEAYVSQRRAAGSQQIKKCNNLVRRLEREVGPLRFVAHEPSQTLLRRILGWKSKQYVATGLPDFLAKPWIMAALERIHLTQLDGFGGLFSILYAGERLVAGHLGMRGRSVWHYWFPSYDPEMAKYSPGVILLLQMAKYAPQIGVHTIDLGLGMSLYKQRLMNATVRIIGGSAELPSFHSSRRNAGRKLRALLKNATFGTPVRDAIKSLGRGQRWARHEK